MPDRPRPISLGYALSSEEHAPLDLVRHARLAEEAGFPFGLISDHFHPWTRRQGHSPFVWGVLGAIAQATERFRIGTGVTAPIIRTHPAIIAHAAATAAALMPGRFFLGLGTGERLNEHVLGDPWPPVHVRQAMLEEAIDVMRQLWTGEEVDFDGDFYSVENARIYTLPEDPIEVSVAASGPESAELAGRIADGLISTAPQRELLAAFRAAGARDDAPVYGQMTVCWATDEASARRTAHEWWPTAALHGELTVELALPVHFEQATQDVTEEQVAKSVVCGADVEAHAAKVRAYAEAGFSHVYVHQVGPDQAGMIDFYRREVMPALQREGLLAAGS